MASKVDTSDPNVRRMVYNMYRGILGNYNDKANDIVSTLPKNAKVTQDQGISKQIESMIRQSNQISGGGGPSPGGPPPPPPPIPQVSSGIIPSMRIPTEIGPRKEPPAAIQNAMMTKDKKPFTYTPGGLDLAEIRSPRMAKRISQNALTEDSTDAVNWATGVQQQQYPQQQHFQQQRPWASQQTPPPIQSRSFRVLQKITGSEPDHQEGVMSPNYTNHSEPVYSMPCYSPRMVSPYENSRVAEGGEINNWWESGNGQNPEWTCPPPEEQQQFWDHYGAMCAYFAQLNAAAYRYSPYPLYQYPLPYPSDSEECGYSSNDEMNYYGQMFKRQWEQAKSNQTEEIKKETVEEGSEEKKGEEEIESEEGSSRTESENEELSQEETIPHQLSIIYEDTEPPSEASERTTHLSDDEDSSATLENVDERRKGSTDSDTEGSGVVKVRLPLKISRSGDVEGVTTITVGDSQMESSQEEDLEQEDETPDVSFTISLKQPKPSSESPVDFWKELKGSDDEEFIKSPSKTPEVSRMDGENNSSEDSVQTVKRVDSESSDESDSDSNSNEDQIPPSHSSTKCGSIKAGNEIRKVKSYIDSKSAIEMNDSSDKGEESDDDDSSESSEISCEDYDAVKSSNNFINSEGPKNDKVQSQGESEEDDSGVTSDISRHISETDTDPECGSELSKMSRYKRAATHSRLFKLLQDECSQDETEESEPIATRKERLTLPLQASFSSDHDSSSSGVNSPMSPAVNDRLVKELVQSLLCRKKGRHFRKLPLDKLYAAASRILQEDTDGDPYDTGSTSDEAFLSPAELPTTATLPNPEYYGQNYYDYCQYYSTWADPSYYRPHDILPSRTFRELQNSSKSAGLGVRCPKVLPPRQDTPSPSLPET